MAEHSDELPEAPQHHHNDDRKTVVPEPSITTIIERIRARSKGSSGDAQKAEGSPPFARSKNLQTVGKPSFLPSPTVDSSVCYTNLLHNGDRRFGAKAPNGRDNRQNFCYTILLHNSRGGLVRRGRWFHYRRRVPDALRTVFGRSEIWVSLKTSNEGVASMRGQSVATAIEQEFARAWADNASSTLPMIGARNAAMLRLITSTVSARLSERQPSPIPEVEHAHANLSLSEVYRLYLADPRHLRCARTLESYGTTGRWIAEFFGGDTPVRQITREQCRGFVTFLQRVPANAHKRFPDLTLRQAVEVTTDLLNVERINAANVNAYLNKFAGSLNWAEQEGFIDRNPARGLRVADPVRKRDKRHPFSIEQLRCIFDAPLYTGCVDDWNGHARVGPNVIRRARFWIPLIGLFSGLRLNEICQLDLTDIIVLDGVLCFSVKATSSQSESEKRVKNVASERIVPVHAELRRLGFGCYLAERRQGEGAKLFPELRIGSTGYHSKAISQWFSRFLIACGAKQPLICFHSFRHNFRDGLRASGVNRDLSLALGGWRNGSTADDVADNYGSGFPPNMLEDAISRVSYQLSLNHLYIE
jgi:integrase